VAVGLPFAVRVPDPSQDATVARQKNSPPASSSLHDCVNSCTWLIFDSATSATSRGWMRISPQVFHLFLGDNAQGKTTCSKPFIFWALCAPSVE
jgi:hypothetical protein